MIHIITKKLPIRGDTGIPGELDMGELEHDLAEAFRKLGFNDVWMAEDIALTIEEKLKSQEGTTLSRSEIDSLVVSLLNASGYADVAMEFAGGRGHNPFEDARKSMKPWTQETVTRILENSLPLTKFQLEELTRRAVQALTQTGITVAADKYITELALHLLINSSRESQPEPQKTGVWTDTLSAAAKSLINSSVLRILPVSQIFPRARVSLNMQELTAQRGTDWLNKEGAAHLMEEITPVMFEILTAMRKDLSKKYPLQADSPSNVVFPSFMSFLGKQPGLWKKRDRAALKNAVEKTVTQLLADAADYPVVVTFKD